MISAGCGLIQSSHRLLSHDGFALSALAREATPDIAFAWAKVSSTLYSCLVSRKWSYSGLCFPHFAISTFRTTLSNHGPQSASYQTPSPPFASPWSQPFNIDEASDHPVGLRAVHAQAWATSAYALLYQSNQRQSNATIQWLPQSWQSGFLDSSSRILIRRP
jgi:hypothetical protein